MLLKNSCRLKGGIKIKYLTPENLYADTESIGTLDFLIGGALKSRVMEIGDRLSRFYYGYSMYGNAFFYAKRVYELLGEETNPRVLNTLGLIYDLYGDYGQALNLYHHALAGYREMVDKSGEGTTLNNISQIYDSRGDYETALKYLEQSLKISREIGDKSGYATTLHNMAAIALQNQNIEKYIEYDMTAYQTALEIDNAFIIYRVGADLGSILCRSGLEEQCLEMLRRSLAIGKIAKFPDVGKIEAILKKFGE
jgi:tetratricopeptide (TPR) repeat protein